jgi:hypothetical protein
MVDRLPRYRREGRDLITPRIDYAGAGAAEARGYQQMSQALDRLSSYAFKEAEIYATEQGEKYGTTNPPTKQQIEDARRAGEDAESVLPGDSFTAFGRAARKSALESLATNMEIDAANELSRLRVEAESQGIPLNQFKTNLDAMIDGYSSALSAVSPSAANAFRASMAARTNSAYMARSAQIEKDAEKVAKLRAVSAFDEIVEYRVEEAIIAGSMIDADGNEYPLTDRLDGLRDQMQRIAYLTEQPEVFNEYIKKFNTKINEHMVGTVTSYISENPLARRLEFQKGNFSDGHVQDVYDNMTREQRDAARKEARTLSSQFLADEAAVDSRNERHRDRLTDNLRAELVDADVAGNIDARNAILSRIKEVDPELYASKVDGYSKETRKDDPETVAQLERLKLNGTLTTVEIEVPFRKGLITIGTFSEFFKSIDGQRNKGFNQALTYAKNEVGYPDRSIINPSIMQNKAIQEVANIHNQLIKLQQENPNADFFAIAQKLSAEAKQRLNGDRADALKKAINAAITMLGLPEGATEAQVRKALKERIGGRGPQQEKQKFTDALTDIDEASQ